MEPRNLLSWILLILPIIGRGGGTQLTPTVIDCDGGADDAFGILLFLWNEANGYKPIRSFTKDTTFGRDDAPTLVAITTVTGNTGVLNATRNVNSTLVAASRTDIPVYPGATFGLMGKHDFDDYYGQDGFGDFLPAVRDRVVENEAVGKLVQLSKQYQGSLILICLGPLTNIALAQRRDPSFLSRIKEIHIMGGTVWGYGNSRPGVEFNIFQDPEAADIVFRETPKFITVMPFDPVVLNPHSKLWRLHVLGKLGSTRMEFLNLAERKALAKKTVWTSSDPQAVAIALWPQLVTKNTLTRVLVETGGVYARGAFLVDHKTEGQIPSPINANMIQQINSNYYEQLLLLAFKD